MEDESRYSPLATSETRMFLEPLENMSGREVREGEIFNDAIALPERARRVLRGLTVMRTVRSHATERSMHYIPSITTGLRKLDLPDEVTQENNGVRILSNERYFVTPTTGRKVFVGPPPSGWTTFLGFDLPGRVVDDDNPQDMHLSVKGIGSAFMYIKEYHLADKNKIVGLSGFDRDEFRLMDRMMSGSYDVSDVWGNRFNTQYVPGRIILYARPLDTVRLHSSDQTETTQVVDLKNPQVLDKFPLLREKDAPYATVCANWSEYTFFDLMWVIGNINHDQKEVAKRDRLTSLTPMLVHLSKQLATHPHYRNLFDNLDKGGYSAEQLTAEFFSRLIVAHTNKMYMDSQMYAQQGVCLVNRHPQNVAIGGDVDLEGCFLVEESTQWKDKMDEYNSDPQKQSLLRMYTYVELESVLYHTIRECSTILPDETKELILERIQALTQKLVENDVVKVEEILKFTKTALDKRQPFISSLKLRNFFTKV